MTFTAGTSVTDKVRLIRELGHGSMGEVWVGEHLTLQTQVAVKFVSPEMLVLQPNAHRRFSIEAAAAARIKSPHVVRTFDHGEMANGTPYIVMELLEGETLHERIEANGPLSVMETFAVIRQLGKALDATHEAHIIHRDVKPHNIFLSEQQGELFVKLLDFGSARVKNEETSHRLTSPGILLGTPEYISRDLISDVKSISRHIDLWAMGVVAYKCLTGVVPFQGEDIASVCKAILAGKMKRPSRLRKELSADYDNWFISVFQEDANQRPQTGAAMASSFRKVAREALRSATPALASSPAATTLIYPEPPKQGTPPNNSASTSDAPPQPPHQQLASNELASNELASNRPAPAKKGSRLWLLPLGCLVLVGAGLGVRQLLQQPGDTNNALSNDGAAGVSSADSSARSAMSAQPSSSAASDASAAADNSAAADGSATPDTSALPLGAGGAGNIPLDLDLDLDGAGGAAAGALKRAPKNLIAALKRSRVVVPAGAFWMGCSGDDETCLENEKPGRSVELDSYAIDRVEVSVALYFTCVRGGGCSADKLGGYQSSGGQFVKSAKCNWTPPMRRNHPINCVDHAQAESFCSWVGGRLPSEAEWEKGARGLDKRRFPWRGETANCNLAVMSSGIPGCRATGTWPTGSKRPGASPYNLLNMAGNVREWVADWYAADYYGNSVNQNPAGPESGPLRVGRGGSWGNAVGKFMRTTVREGVSPESRSIHLGFRCANSIDKPPTP